MKSFFQKLLISGILATGLTLVGTFPATASSTQVTFQVPLQIQNLNLSPSLGSATFVSCTITQNSKVAGVAMVRFRATAGTSTISVPVKAKPGMSFKKGDDWSCRFPYEYRLRSYMAPGSVWATSGKL